MSDRRHEFHPLEDFIERSKEFLARLKSARQPLVLTVDGQPAAVLHDPAAYERLIEASGDAVVAEAFRQAIHDVATGAAPSTHDGLAEFGQERGIL